MFCTVLQVYLQISVNPDERSFFNFERAGDGIDEEGQLAHAARVLVGGA